MFIWNHNKWNSSERIYKTRYEEDKMLCKEKV